MPTTTERLVVFDVDLTLWCGCFVYDGPRCEPNTVMLELLLDELDKGSRVVLWSGGGAEHARSVARRLKLPEDIECYAKPDFPPLPEDVIDLLGRIPDLTVDDDEEERVEGAGFLLVDDYNPHGWWVRRS